MKCRLPKYYIQYYQNKPKLNDVYSRNNLAQRKVGAYKISLNEYKLTGTYSIALYGNSGSSSYDAT